MLMEGVSVRSTVRLTGISKGAILRLLKTVGERAMRYWSLKMRNLPATDVEVDEIWGYIGCKEKTRLRKHYGEGCGDCYTFVGIERTTKLILAWHTGKRTPNDTVIFSESLRRAVPARCQLTTDGYGPYTTAIPAAFGGQVDFAQLIKEYGIDPTNLAGRSLPGNNRHTLAVRLRLSRSEPCLHVPY